MVNKSSTTFVHPRSYIANISHTDLTETTYLKQNLTMKKETPLKSVLDSLTSSLSNLIPLSELKIRLS